MKGSFDSMLIVNIPHSSVNINDYSNFNLNKCEIDAEAKMLADLYTDELIENNSYTEILRSDISRLVVDTERFVDDSQEIAASYGMGVIYNKTHDGRILREKPSLEQREQLLNEYYYPYHQKLKEYVDENLFIYDKCLIIDLHSYSKISVPVNKTNTELPDICIGYTPYHFNQDILDLIISFCKDNHYTYALNTPFSGSIVPLEYYLKNRNIVSFMIEIHKSVYMDEKAYTKKNSFVIFKRQLQFLMEQLYHNFYEETQVNLIKKVYMIRQNLLKLYEKYGSAKNRNEAFDKCDNILKNSSFELINTENFLLLDEFKARAYRLKSIILFVVYMPDSESMIFPCNIEKNCPESLLKLSCILLEATDKIKMT